MRRLAFLTLAALALAAPARAAVVNPSYAGSYSVPFGLSFSSEVGWVGINAPHDNRAFAIFNLSQITTPIVSLDLLVNMFVQPTMSNPGTTASVGISEPPPIVSPPPLIPQYSVSYDTIGQGGFAAIGPFPVSGGVLIHLGPAQLAHAEAARLAGRLWTLGFVANGHGFITTSQLLTVETPEPSSLALAAVGLACVVVAVGRRRRRAYR